MNSKRLPQKVLGILETTGWTPAILGLDAMEKQANIQVVQAELNDFLGIVIKVTGSLSDVEAALAVGHSMAEKLGGQPVSSILERVADEAVDVLISSPEHNPLIQQDVVHFPIASSSAAGNSNEAEPDSKAASSKSKTSRSRTSTKTSSKSSPSQDLSSMSSQDQHLALGFIETQGFTAVFEAIDTACKAAQVEVIGKEKLGGGYVTVVIQGDVAAVKTAIETGAHKVEGLGKLIAAHVIARPSEAVRALLPK